MIESHSMLSSIQQSECYFYKRKYNVNYVILLREFEILCSYKIINENYNL